MKKVYEGTLVVSLDEKHLLPAKGGVIRDNVEKKEKIMYRKVTPNYAEEIATNICFPLVSLVGNSTRSFYNNNSCVDAKAAILMEKENIVREEDAKEYINQFVENYNEKYLELKSLAEQNQSVQDAMISQIKYGVSFVKGYIQETITDTKEKIIEKKEERTESKQKTKIKRSFV